ncbi:DNA circularization N-terminal domain-containing protein [uncultured Vibrio sp.]|uniref:DNA circularization N-terminal domain-containing protein n=1 Tax=uncultured Vibrio sp. TaxID=114054 RepID=UPI0025DF90AF|nr:DNA circularization N-terminal domain-containing protein [uncultured Vibrio sp.]
MWERQYEHARWNGFKLNIISTAFDGGKRLQVSEIPYADLPHIKVMGTKARTYTIEAVFVGPSSLADATALIDNLEATPEGELEHPWLGELPLTYEEVSQSISTKKGLVTLSLKFVRSGTSPSITTSSASVVRTKAQASAVKELSKKAFIEEVKELDVAEINEVQENAHSALNVLVGLSNRLDLPDETLQEVSHAIHEASSAISSISTTPDEFADLFTAAFDVVADAVQALPDSDSEAIDNSRNAQSLILSEVKPDSPTQYHNVQMVTAAVKMNKDITTLEAGDHFDITQSVKQPDTIKSDLSILVTNIDDRIAGTTQVSTQESVELFDSLTALKSSVKTQQDKVIEGTTPHRTVESPRFQPALTIAHNEFTQERIVTKMNALQHPLFIHGDIAIRDAV